MRSGFLVFWTASSRARHLALNSEMATSCIAFHLINQHNLIMVKKSGQHSPRPPYPPRQKKESPRFRGLFLQQIGYFLTASPALPYLRRKRSTRPAVSISFCLPVKNGWQAEQISSEISPLWVERVVKLLPQAQCTRICS